MLRNNDDLVLQGAMTWVSPVQPSYIMQMTTLPEMHIAVTVDIQSTIKLWDCQNSEALATSNLESPCKLLKAVFTKDGPMVLVSDPLIWNTHTEQNTCQF